MIANIIIVKITKTQERETFLQVLTEIKSYYNVVVEAFVESLLYL